jgi:HK97 family phage major capsid protein
MIANGVQSEITEKLESLSDALASKVIEDAKVQREKAIDTGTKVDDPHREVTRNFLKALIGQDAVALEEMKQKATTYNYTGDDARGGYLIPEELLAEVLRIKEEQYGLARREFQYLPFSGPGNERKIPTLSSSVSVYWIDEAAAKTSSNPVFGLVTQTLKKLVAMVPFTEEIIEDSAVNLTELIAKLFAEATAKEEDVQFFYGTGSPWTGILNNGSVGSVALAATEGIADVTFEKLVDMQDELPSGAIAGAKYYMHRHVLSYLRKLRTSAITASDNLGAFLLPLNKSGIEGILDFPIELSDAFPDKTLTGADKPFVIFGNLKMAAIFGDKQQIRAKLLDQATITDGDGETSINLAQQNMLALRLEERVGYVLALPTAVVVLKTGAAS